MVSDRREKRAKPLLYAHPVSGQPTLCFHLGMTDAFVYDYGTPQQRVTGREETAALLEEMESKFTKDCAHLIYSHHWEQGDFIISDNAALGHEASPTTQDLSNGLRVMHRTTIKGTVPPRKKNGRGQVGGGQIV
jgi:taurine dioxygenase